MHDLTKKIAQLEWIPAQQVSFEQLGLEVATAPVLQYPDYTGSFIVDTDANNISIGAVLSKKINGADRAVFVTSVKQYEYDAIDHQKRGPGGNTSPEIVPTVSDGRAIRRKN